MKHIICKATALGLLAACAISCSKFDDVLDRKPLDSVSPDNYYTSASQLSAFTINLYAMLPNVNGQWGAGQATWDDGTDNQAGVNPNRMRFLRDNWKVPAEGGVGFENIRNINYFLAQVEPKIAAKSISGSEAEINQYLGEAYFFRAYDYFSKLKTYGDYPIIKTPLADKGPELQEAAKRMPRNEVARFIIEDLEKAISLLPQSTVGNQRISKHVAQLFLSRVALYEATFEKYHAGTGRVPGDANWPGKSKEWNAGKTFDQAGEVRFFLEKAVAASKVVADAVALTQNTGVLNPSNAYHGWNPYFEMFGSTNLSAVPEVLLWRQYGAKAGLVHHTTRRLSEGTSNGWTRGLVDCFLTSTGLPVYNSSFSYNDATAKQAKANRDQRLQLFLFGEDDVLTMANNAVAVRYTNPRLLETAENKDVTGYRQRKFYNYSPEMNANTQVDETATIIFRAAEAYLNYIEASYLLNNTLTSEARTYWERLRTRAGITGTIQTTIDATEMSREANVNRPSYDWGAFSKGEAIDATLYSIRRERRCEFAGEGYRWDDLVRWRALDQVRNYQIEGANFWTTVHEHDYFKNEAKTASRIVADGSSSALISARSLGVHLRPYQIVSVNNDMYNGYTFHQSFYLSPFSYDELLLCSPTADAANSNLYQTFGWRPVSNSEAE